MSKIKSAYEQCELHLQKSKNTVSSDLKTSKMELEKAYEYADKIKHPHQYYRCKLLETNIIEWQQGQKKAFRHLQDVQAEIKGNDSLEEIYIESKIIMLKFLYFQGKMKELVKLADELIGHSIVQNSNKKIANVKMLKGIAYLSMNDLINAYEFLLKAQLYAKEDKSLESVANLDIWIGVVGTKMNDLDLAIDHYLDALKFYKKHNKASGIGNAYNSLGLVMIDKKELDKAEEYFMLAKEQFEKYNYYNKLADIHSNLGMLYKEKKEYQKAIEFYYKSLEFRKSGNLYHEILTLSNLCMLYNNIQEWEKSYAISSKALALNKNLYKDYNLFDFMISRLEPLFHLKKTEEYKECDSLIQENIDTLSDNVKKFYWKVKADIFIEQSDFEAATHALEEVVKIGEEARKTELKLQAKLIKSKMEIRDKMAKLAEEKKQNKKLRELNEKLKKAQKEIVALEKHNAVLAMGVTVNHEIRQPLSVIYGQVDMMKIEFEKSEPANEKRIMKISENLERINKLLKKYQEFDTFVEEDYIKINKILKF